MPRRPSVQFHLNPEVHHEVREQPRPIVASVWTLKRPPTKIPDAHVIISGSLENPRACYARIELLGDSGKRIRRRPGLEFIVAVEGNEIGRLVTIAPQPVNLQYTGAASAS